MTGISFSIVLIISQIDGFLNTKVGSFLSDSMAESNISLLSSINSIFHPFHIGNAYGNL
jgi:hypothetical protein